MAKKSFLLRISPKLWDELQAWADQELRSVNSQIEYILREATARKRRAVASETDDDDRIDPVKEEA